jgi:hypothetical protein
VAVAAAATGVAAVGSDTDAAVPSVGATPTEVDATSVGFAGGVQVSAEPGLRVFLDGQLAGTTSAREDGLYLNEVARGRHTVRVEKDGFEPQTFEVQVVNRPIEVEVAEFLPIQAAAVGAAAKKKGGLLGTLVVTSAPQNVTVEIDGRVEQKSTPQLSIGGLSVGEHTITFSKEGFEPVTSTITIQAGADNTIHGDLKATKVAVVHQGMGSLRIISKPMRTTVWFRNEIHEKVYDRLNIQKIPAGEYPMMVMIPGRKLSTTVLIVDGQRTTVEVSFMKGDDAFVITRTQR